MPAMQSRIWVTKGSRELGKYGEDNIIPGIIYGMKKFSPFKLFTLFLKVVFWGEIYVR